MTYRKKPQVRGPGRVQTSHAAARMTRTPATWSSARTVVTHPLYGRCRATISTSRAGRSAVATSARSARCRSMTSRIPPRAAIALAHFSVLTGMQRILARSSRSPVPQAGLKGGRCRVIRERPPHVGDEAVIVRVEAEGAERLHQASEVGDDHR